MTERSITNLNEYKSKSKVSAPREVLIIEDCDTYFDYFCETMVGSGLKVIRTHDFQSAKAYLEFRSPPSLVVFDYIAIGDRTKNFVDWVRTKPNLEDCYLLLATYALYADSLSRQLFVDYIPKNMDQDVFQSYVLQSIGDSLKQK